VKEKEPDTMKEAMGTSDIIIGIIAGLGVVVLLVVFVMVVRKILSKDSDTE
jgi:uncharacterized membrane protein